MEMILIEAEANAHLGNDLAARTALFSLVSQRDPNPNPSIAFYHFPVNETFAPHPSV